MGEPTDGQKEIQALQTRILGLEETLTQLKKGGDESKAAQKKIDELEAALIAVRKEKEDLQQKIWDRKERRAKERRMPAEGSRENKPKGDDDAEDPWSGHF